MVPRGQFVTILLRRLCWRRWGYGGLRLQNNLEVWTLKTLKGLTSLLVIMGLVFGSIPALAYSAVLPNGQVLGDEQLEEVEGEGPTTALVAGAIGFIGGGVTGAVGYAADYAWEKYVAKSDPVFDGDELSKQVWTGAVTGGVGAFVGGLLSPSP